MIARRRLIIPSLGPSSHRGRDDESSGQFHIQRVTVRDADQVEIMQSAPSASDCCSAMGRLTDWR
jgi:hypothetical protein